MMMKKLKKFPHLLILVMMSLLVFHAQAKAQSDKIEGVWYNDIKSAKIEIYKANNGKFFGKIIWLKDPLENGKPRTDTENSDEKLRNRPIIGLPILQNFRKDGENKYVDGTIYDPKNGKTYDCKITYKGKTLDIRGYIGISLLGRTTTWERAS